MSVISKLGRLKRFVKLNPNLRETVEFLNKLSQNLPNLSDGVSEKIHLQQGVFLILQSFQTRDRETCVYESHRKYVDIQLMLKGRELMETRDITGLEIRTPYEDEKDIMFYDYNLEGARFVLEVGDVAIYFPEDAHRVGAQVDVPMFCTKVVAKVPVDLW